MMGHDRKVEGFFFYWTRAKAVQPDGARTLQTSIIQQSTGLLAMKAAALHDDRMRTL
jgi:hypothetical protein